MSTHIPLLLPENIGVCRLFFINENSLCLDSGDSRRHYFKTPTGNYTFTGYAVKTANGWRFEEKPTILRWKWRNWPGMTQKTAQPDKETAEKLIQAVLDAIPETLR